MNDDALASMIATLRDCRSRADYLAAMARCRIAADDIAAFCQYGEDGYRRNALDVTDEHELVAICWRPGQASPVHNHGRSQCCVRVLQGALEECRFVRAHGASAPLAEAGFSRLEPCAETKFDSAEDFHRLAGVDPAGSISLHLYVPPLADYETVELPL
ncbi:cysteine dioxygenase family protein [Stenotrophomonas sp. HITSZ_GD]|uniref:cysteine dioxygenase n=1 Tax=Stenotrophomonas sp. HITSZ_GD TaxID=3037248 RepID=UPI00240E2E42|nr:cysteine dioxygenase family protein [Stenotrophomonas sp. HITSZ_GD]MDG2526461.1 cysteine dioxygenase family protein [Stenotrophomonas sp. HITSZ_GD]